VSSNGQHGVEFRRDAIRSRRAGRCDPTGHLVPANRHHQLQRGGLIEPQPAAGGIDVGLGVRK